jgi:hypothetical protein
MNEPTPCTTSRPSIPRKTNWFRAKPSCLGWDWSLCWQGWLSYALALAGIIVAAVLFPPTRSPTAFMAGNLLIVVLLLGVCALKGEPLRRAR